MGDEFIEIRFPDNRKAYVREYGDPEPRDRYIGDTNEILRIDTAEHTFHLGEPENYTPLTQKIFVKDTNPLKPIIIEFKEV
jgi:hypothetical protein